MAEPFVSRGFRGRRQPGGDRTPVPPRQYETRDFPVLSAGPTPHTSPATWDFTVLGPGGPAARWTWDEFQALPHETVTTDIHCVTKWSKLDTVWEGVSVDTLFKEALARGVELAPYVLAVSDGGYTTNLPLADVTRGKAWVAVKYDGAPLAPEHGGPARLLVPHLYFWKSAKWVRQLRLIDRDEAVALITSEIIELIRDGKSAAEITSIGPTILPRDAVMEGVSEMIGEVQVEDTFPDGIKLVTIHQPSSSCRGSPPRWRRA